MNFSLGLSAVRNILPRRVPRKKNDEASGYMVVEWVTSLTVRHGFLTILSDQLLFIYSILQEKTNKIALKNHSLQDNRRLVKEWPL